MKITKTELIQTIKEELEDMLEYSVEDPHDKLDRMLKDRGVESDQEPGESEEDYWKRKEKKGMSDLFKSGVPQRAARNLPENKMKITKTKLKEIVKEELKYTIEGLDFDRYATQPAGAELTDLPPEAMEELSQMMNMPNIEAIQDEQRRKIIMNSFIDHLKDKYGIQ
tara:strand:- start:70 stop:570 length:501 start_codon:yes stop_codon:yes gene_type:complete